MDPSHFLFLAAMPKANEAAVIDGLRREHWPSADRFGEVSRENLHVTVLPIAETVTAAALAPTIQATITRLSVLPSEEAFDVCFPKAASLSFPGAQRRTPFALWAGPGKAGVQKCRRRLRDALVDVIHPDFVQWKGADPHMTLSWRLDRIGPVALEKPVVWTVDEIVLIHSHRGEGRYDVLDRWPLTPFLLH